MSKSKSNNLVIGIYFHPEAYPPTLNAIGELSECFDSVTVVHRPHLKNNWTYPANVTAIPAGSPIGSVEQQQASFLKKIAFFINYVKVFYAQCIKQKPSCILVYDNLSFYAYRLVRPLLSFRHKIWYHNHDVVETSQLRKYSIGWMAARTESAAFKYLDIFSLPTNDRMRYFPLDDFKGKYFFIPNYPSRRFYNKFYQVREPKDVLKLIFQGQVGTHHGIEEIIPLLKEPVGGFPLQLYLKGPCSQDYKENVLKLAAENGVTSSVFFIGVTPYAEVPVAASQCHIGIGILAKKDLMNVTLGTASNKLYEYAAVGLPVIYYNSESFTRYLGKFAWAVPADLNSESIKEAVIRIVGDYYNLQAAAHNDFLSMLNFEKGFEPVKEYLLENNRL